MTELRYEAVQKREGNITQNLVGYRDRIGKALLSEFDFKSPEKSGGSRKL